MGIRLLAVAMLQSVLLLSACGHTRPTIALIPRTCGTPLWEPEHAGADSLARTMNYQLYWNAPVQENDTQRQILIMDQALSRKSKGIIVSPDETLAFRSPILNVAAHQVPVVVVDTELGLSPNNYISYLLNDEVAGGELAAHRIGEVLHGHGDIVIVGINTRLLSLTMRQRSFERIMVRDYPNIRISARRLGDLSVPHEQEVTEELIQSDEHIDAIVALSASATRGAYYALLEAKRVRSIALIGFDQDMFGPVRAGEIDAIVIQNTYEIGTHCGQMHRRPTEAKRCPEQDCGSSDPSDPGQPGLPGDATDIELSLLQVGCTTVTPTPRKRRSLLLLATSLCSLAVRCWSASAETHFRLPRSPVLRCRRVIRLGSSWRDLGKYRRSNTEYFRAARRQANERLAPLEELFR